MPARLRFKAVAAGGGGLPSWAPGLGEYADISILTAENTPGIDPCPAANCLYSGNEGQPAIWNDWNGGAYASAFGTYGSFIVHGGGHAGYYGNEVLRYDIETQEWFRLNDPSPYGDRIGALWPNDAQADPSIVNSYGAFPDGNPNPIHTYFNFEYLPPSAGGGTAGSVIFMHRENSNSFVSDPRIWRFDLALGTWSNGHTMQKVGGSHLLHALIYDSNRQGIWNVAQDDDASSLGISFYSFLTNTETSVPLNSGNSFNLGLRFGCAMGAYHAGRDFLLLFRNSTGHALACVDLSSFTLGVSAFAPTHEITQSGTPHPNVQGGSNYPTGLEYCSYDGNFYALDYPAASGRLYKLTVPASLTGTWAWSSEVLTPKAGTSSIASVFRSADNHFFNRFRYVHALKSFVWSDAQELAVQAGRPSNFT